MKALLTSLTVNIMIQADSAYIFYNTAQLIPTPPHQMSILDPICFSGTSRAPQMSILIEMSADLQYWIPSVSLGPAEPPPPDVHNGSYLLLRDRPSTPDTHIGSHLPLLDQPSLQMSALDPICLCWTTRTIQMSTLDQVWTSA